MIFEFFAKASAAWETEWQRVQDEANRKRSEAMAGNTNASKLPKENSQASNDAPLATKPKPQKASTKKAKAAGVSEKTAERAHAVVENRPDLAEKVRTGAMTLNEATREMKRDEIRQRLVDMATSPCLAPSIPAPLSGTVAPAYSNQLPQQD